MDLVAYRKASIQKAFLFSSLEKVSRCMRLKKVVAEISLKCSCIRTESKRLGQP